MRQAMPPITEQAADLKQRLRREHDRHKQPRLQMLYLLASGQARERQEVARLLGVHRNTIGRWLAVYAAGGLEALLATYVPPGKPVSLAPQVLASLEQALHRPEGFASYEALRQWVLQPVEHHHAQRYRGAGDQNHEERRSERTDERPVELIIGSRRYELAEQRCLTTEPGSRYREQPIR